MIQELADKVWANPRYRATVQAIEFAWLGRQVGAPESPSPPLSEAARLMQASAILAASNSDSHRHSAYRAATAIYGLFGGDKLPFDQALRVVLSRLGNFPALTTNANVFESLSCLPFALALENIADADERAIEVDGRTRYLTNFQHDLWLELTQSSHLAIAAPTSAGKSFVLKSYLSAIFSDKTPRTVVYIVPTRALIAQVATDIEAELSSDHPIHPEVITVPLDANATLAPRAVYVMTQERVQLALDTHPGFAAQVIVVDEAHGVGDGARGVLLQSVVDGLLARNPTAQILFASPTIRNLEVFGRLFGLSDLRRLSSTEPTVAQNFFNVKVVSATNGRLRILSAGRDLDTAEEICTLTLNQTVAGRVDRLVRIAAAIGRNDPSIIYADGPDDAESIAIMLGQIRSKEYEPTSAQLALADLVRESIHGSYVLAECVKSGVGFHYSNIPTHVRREVEAAFSRGDLAFLVCTSTLLQGVNLPARNIFMYRPQKGLGNALESTDFWNLAGRAGRLGHEFHGNIFLIDYEKWKKKPLEGERDSEVKPALLTSVSERTSQLARVIEGNDSTLASSKIDLETAFVRLFSDYKRGQLSTTFERLGLTSDSSSVSELTTAIDSASGRITLPIGIIQKSPSISAHKQERMYQEILAALKVGDVDTAETFLPLHPREFDAFVSYASILELCHRVVLGIDTGRNLHRFHAVMAIKWMRGTSLPQIIEEQLVRNQTKSRRTTIRSTLELIESQLRFQAVRLFGCYIALLSHALTETGHSELLPSIPSIPLYLEVGASDRTMISLIALGLSRPVATRLNAATADKSLDLDGARTLLRTGFYEQVNLSPLLLEEVRAVARSKS